MATFEDKFNDVLTKYLQENNPGLDVDYVTGFSDYTYESGYCDTCYYTEQRVRIDYVNTSGSENWYEYHGTFSELLSGLLEVEVD